MDLLLAQLPQALRRWDETDPVLAGLARAHVPEEIAIQGTAASDARTGHAGASETGARGAAASHAGASETGARDAGAKQAGASREGARDAEASRAGFAVMAQSIVHQQVSLAAGRSIWGRVERATGGLPEGFIAQGEAVLRAAGLSRQKAAYCLDLAARTLDGSLDWDALPELDDEQVIQRLVAVKGIGTWTAKMFLIFHLQRPDVCPWEDLGVRLAVERFYAVSQKDAVAWLRKEAAPRWSPYNSLAARVLWNARRVA